MKKYVVAYYHLKLEKIYFSRDFNELNEAEKYAEVPKPNSKLLKIIELEI